MVAVTASGDSVTGVIRSGNFDLSGVWIPDVATGSGSDVDLFTVDTTAGAIRLTYEVSTGRMRGYARGTNVLNTAAVATGPPEGTFQNWRAGDHVEFRMFYPTIPIGRYGLRLAVNGCGSADTAGTSTSATLGTPTGLLIQGRSEVWGAATFGTLTSELGASTTANQPCDIVMLGDSILAPRLLDPAVGALLAPDHARRGRTRIYTHAQSGAKVDGATGQTSKWLVSASRGSSRCKAVVIQCGVNNVAQGETSSQVLAALKTLIADIRVNNPRSKILLCTMTPGRGYLTSGQLAHHVAINAAITARQLDCDAMVNTFAVLADAQGSMLSQFDIGDHLHTNLAGRLQNAETIAAALDTYGARYA